MLLSTKGIIIRNLKYAESSLILDIYTEELGMRSYIISGIRSKNSKTKSGILQIMSLVELIAYQKENKNLNRIKEIKAHHYFNQIPFHMTKRAIGIFMIEIIHRSIREQEQNLPLFNFLWQSFLHLDRTVEKVHTYPHTFLITFSKYLGFFPNDNWAPTRSFFNLMEGQFEGNIAQSKYILEKTESKYLFQLLQVDLASCHEISIPKNIRKTLLEELIKYYRLHVESFGHLKSLPILEEIFN